MPVKARRTFKNIKKSRRRIKCYRPLDAKRPSDVLDPPRPLDASNSGTIHAIGNLTIQSDSVEVTVGKFERCGSTDVQFLERQGASMEEDPKTNIKRQHGHQMPIFMTIRCLSTMISIAALSTSALPVVASFLRSH